MLQVWQDLCLLSCHPYYSLKPLTNDYQGIARLLSRWAPNIVISLGSEGVFARNIDGQAVYYPAHRVNAISSIGAGDSLISELIVRMLEGMPFFEAVQRANAVAATVVASANGLLSRADESSIMNLLKENIKYNIFSS
jgi:sugar/nucleoside kinase (ribokinase family)